jgi:hypothetical protein
MPISAANQIVSQAVSWLWPERIPLGKLVLLDGDPDLGESIDGQWVPKRSNWSRACRGPRVSALGVSVCREFGAG